MSRLLAPRWSVRSALGLLALVGMGALAERSPPRAPLSLDDLAAVRDVAEPHLSPNGYGVAFSVTQDDVAEDRRKTELSEVRRNTTQFDIDHHDAIVVLDSTPLEPAEVYTLEGTLRRLLSRQNNRLLARLALGRVDEIAWSSPDGTSVHGLITFPPNIRTGRRMPALLHLHGGPTSQFANEFDFEQQLLATNGYLVLAPNPRGSAGRDEAYAAAIYTDWGNKDVADVVAGGDYIVARGIADAERLGIGGWSYGGMLTNHTIARDGRFRAAVSGALCAVAFLLLLWAIYWLRLRHLTRTSNMTLEARVNERTRIARELHDTLLQSLHGLMFQFQAVRNLLPRRPDEAIRSLDHAIDDTERALAESQDAIRDLRSEPLARGNLGALLLATSRELAQSATADQQPPVFDLIEEGEKRALSSTAKNEVCRIALEILRNAYRHAHATRIEAEIRYDERLLRIRIRDNGRGIDSRVLKEGGIAGHWGLRGVRERAERIGARLDFWSEAGVGTEVQLTVPADVAYQTAGDDVGSRLLRKVRRRAEHS